MENIRLSVVVPVYNLEDCVERSLGSILAQTHRNLEVLAVDDGSQDGTLARLQAMAEQDSRVRVLRQEHQGPAAARLRGIRAATGDYVGFCDGDDELEPEMYEILLRNARTCGADISHCGLSMVYRDRTDRYYGTGRLLLQSRESGLRDLLTGEFIEPHLGAKLFRRELFSALPEDLPLLRHSEDLLMNFYLFRAAERSVYEDRCLYRYLVRAGSLSRREPDENALLDPLRAAELLCRETEGDPVLYPLALERRLRQLIRLATIQLQTGEDWKAPIRREARRRLRESRQESGPCGLRLRAMVLWAGLWPGSYGLVHRRYERLTGLDRKYAP